MTRLEKEYMKFMATTGIVNMNIKNDTPQGLKSRFLDHWYPLYQMGFCGHFMCIGTISNIVIHGNQNVLQRNGPVLTPSLLALMSGESQMSFCKAGAKLAWINAYFFL